MPNLLVILLIVLLLFGSVGLAPGVGFAHPYGWYPSGGVGLILVVLIVVLLLHGG